MYQRTLIFPGVCLLLFFMYLVPVMAINNAHIVKTDKSEGMICTNFKDWARFFPKGCEFWQPSREEILKGEAAIEKYLAHACPGIKVKLSSYKRQYVGFIVNNHKRIFNNFYCDNSFYPAKPGASLTEEPMIYQDGGDCYFNIEYDLQDGKCYSLWVNGLA